MKFTRFKDYTRFQTKGTKEDFERTAEYANEEIVDKTNFRPSAESVRANLLKPNGMGSARIGIYDFQDGLDTGFNPYRDIGADIVDLKRKEEEIINDGKKSKTKSEELKAVQEAIQEGVSNALNKADAEAAEE